MRSSLVVALGALFFTSIALAQDDDTPTNWITPTATLPSPYESASAFTTTDSAGACLASLAVYSSVNCRLQTTVWPATTTLPFNVDCYGCDRLAVSVRQGHCPLGGTHSRYPDTTMSTARTRWSFVCAPSPTPAPTNDATGA